MSNYRTTDGENHPLPKSDRRRRRVRWTTLILLALAALLAGGFIIPTPLWVTCTGYVTSEEYAEVRPPVPGIVASIHVVSGQEVEKDALLVQLQDDQQRAAYQETESHVRQAEALLARREAELSQRERERDQALAEQRLRATHAATRLKLATELHERGLSSGTALDDARLNASLAESILAGMEARDASLPDKELAVYKRDAEVTHDALQRAQALLESLRIKAPIAGRVVRYPFVVGEYVKPDDVIYEIFGGQRQILKVRIPERFATRVEVGQRSRTRLLPFRGLFAPRFFGKVERLRNTIETDSQRTYRQAICTFDAQGLNVPPGTTAEVRISVGRVPLWSNLLGL